MRIAITIATEWRDGRVLAVAASGVSIDGARTSVADGDGNTAVFYHEAALKHTAAAAAAACPKGAGTSAASASAGDDKVSKRRVATGAA